MVEGVFVSIGDKIVKGSSFGILGSCLGFLFIKWVDNYSNLFWKVIVGLGS